MRILIALDRSEYAEIVLEHGLDQAARHPGAELHVVTAIHHESERAVAAAWLDELVRDGVDSFGSAAPVTRHVRYGSPVHVVTELAAELPADLLVLGRFHVPSESDAIVGGVDCPTLVVGIDGPVLEPQCPACRAVRRDSEGERLFCAEHAGDRLPDLVTRLPRAAIGRGLW